MSFSRENEIECESDTFLSVAIAHTVFKIRIDETPAIQTDDQTKAQIFNTLYENGLNIGQVHLIEQILSIFAKEKGIEPPRFEFDKASVLSGSIAAANPHNMVRFFLGQALNQTGFAENIESIAHESQHLLQFFYIKMFLTGKDVPIQYKIMAFQQLFEFCGITAPKTDFFANNKYWFNAMEIDARKTSTEYLMNLVNNQHLSPEARDSVLNYVYYYLESSANLYRSGTKLLKQLDWQKDKFDKIFGHRPLGKAILNEYNNSRTAMDFYARQLDSYANGLFGEIECIKQNEKQNEKAIKIM